MPSMTYCRFSILLYVLVFYLCYVNAATTRGTTEFTPSTSSIISSTSVSDGPTRAASLATTTDESAQSSPAISGTPITSTNSTGTNAAGDKYKPWEVFGVILLLALIAMGICVGIVIKKRRRRGLRAKRLKDEPSVNYASKWKRKNTADPPTQRFSSPVLVDPSPQPVREGSDGWPSEDSVVSSEVGEIRMRKDAPSPSVNTIRSDDNIEGIDGVASVQNDARESVYDVRPVHHIDTKKLID